MSIGPVPWVDIIIFAQFHGLDDEMLPIFARVMRALDAEYLKWVGKKKPENG